MVVSSSSSCQSPVAGGLGFQIPAAVSNVNVFTAHAAPTKTAFGITSMRNDDGIPVILFQRVLKSQRAE